MKNSSAQQIKKIREKRSSSLNTEQSETNGKPPKMREAALEIKELISQVKALTYDMDQHNKAIKFLLSTNKQFQNEIQKKEIKQKEAQNETPKKT